ncbi:leukotriene B4 receptor 1-like [Esox lucius]|uniref:G-protein coupled receptors family 1 profile domain-containing protein n=1 Tax=Esox lucius TaxID=8010 RepID=A0AAY5LAR4_ESOLU|nr:leukotriene B4 receptor 1-like [Esox lucius]
MQSYPYYHITRVMPSVIMVFCFMVGIPGNLMVMIVLCRRFEGGNFTMLLMLHLALCDLMALLCLPLAVNNLLNSWALEAATCKLLFFLIHCSLNSSVFTITLLSVQRYIQVLYPHSWARLGRMGEKALLVSLWGLAGTIASPTLSVRDMKRNTFDGNMYCVSHYLSSGQEITTLLIQTLFGFGFPSCILATSYFYLHRRVSQAALFRQRRLTKLVTYIVVSFFCFWTPLHIFNLLALGNMVMKSDEVKDVCQTAWDIILAFTLINSCLNPFLYAFASSAIPRTSPQPNNI